MAMEFGASDVEGSHFIVAGGMVKKVNAFGLERIPEARTSAKTMWFGPGETGIVEVRLTGSDRAVLRDKAEVLMAALRAIPGTLNINQDWENKVLTVKVIVDQVRARRTGVTSEEVADSLNAFIDGAYITDYREGDTVIPVVIRAVEEERDNIAQLRNINIYSSKTGKNVPLSQIANFEPRWDPSVIKRFNQERTITVEARHQFLKAAQLFAKLRPAIDGLDPPAGYSWEVGGEIESSRESNQKLAKNLPLCLALVVFLLVWQFNSFRRPAIIMLTIPMSFVGGIIGLLVMGAPFGFMAILGFLSLAGIIINNGIVLIDRIDIEHEAGKDAYEAIVSAALARARPIVMTTITTILGLMPLIVWKDPLFFGMANVIAFGLLVGTVLTLVVVPVLYSLLFRVKAPVKVTG
ncbi:MAG TPA: efflux RND transporter permease subunit [Rhodospirillaceae bacterium]|nr:efflux RND transporter permease subunit [Rhodospirillaceae bacterium]